MVLPRRSSISVLVFLFVSPSIVAELCLTPGVNVGSLLATPGSFFPCSRDFAGGLEFADYNSLFPAAVL